MRPPPYAVRETIAIAVLACACGAAVGKKTGGVDGRSRGPSSADEGSAVGDGTRDAPAAGFEALEARGPAIAPGMRELARRESREARDDTRNEASPDRVELLKSLAHDTCARVAFEATGPVATKLVDASGRVLAATSGPSTEGLLGDQGPVCMRKGDSLIAVVEGPQARTAHVRFVAWGSP